jgi:uncharacterized membrane protein
MFVYLLGGQNFKLVLANFDYVCWTYSVLTGVFVILQQVCRFIALQNEKAAKL